MVTMEKTYSKHAIYEILTKYNWMIKEYNRIKLQLNNVETVGVAVYSDEPKGSQSAPSQRIEGEVIRREKKFDRLKEYDDKITYISQRLDSVEDEKHKVVLDCILDGMSMNAIAIHLNTSRRTVFKIRDTIVYKIAHK